MTEASDRLSALRQLLSEGAASTQEELREELEARGFSVTQSTISRDLKRVGAVKAIDAAGRTIYRLEGSGIAPLAMPTGSLRDLVNAIRTNGNMIVINTSPGSASLVARHLDAHRPGGILGTIAGDDTIFVAPENLKQIDSTIRQIEASLNS